MAFTEKEFLISKDIEQAINIMAESYDDEKSYDEDEYLIESVFKLIKERYKDEKGCYNGKEIEIIKNKFKNVFGEVL